MLPYWLAVSALYDLYHGVESNASSPMLVTLSGMVTEVRLEQPENAKLSMLVILSGMVIEVRLVQDPYPLIADYQYFMSNTTEE
jgi:hypothetical protein